jgi:hypothetical protein
MARVRERRAADKTASHAVLYFPDRTEESVIGELDRPRHLHRHHDHHQHDQEQHHHHHHQFHRHSKEAKSNPFEVAHFPPPRLYGSSRLSSALPPGSPCPAAAADVDVGHRRETRAEGNTKTDEEEQLPDFPFPVSPPDTWALMRSLEQLYRDGRTAINRDTIVGRKLYNFRDLSGASVAQPRRPLATNDRYSLGPSSRVVCVVCCRGYAERKTRSEGGVAENIQVGVPVAWRCGPRRRGEESPLPQGVRAGQDHDRLPVLLSPLLPSLASSLDISSHIHFVWCVYVVCVCGVCVVCVWCVWCVVCVCVVVTAV